MGIFSPVNSILQLQTRVLKGNKRVYKGAWSPLAKKREYEVTKFMINLQP